MCMSYVSVVITSSLCYIRKFVLIFVVFSTYVCLYILIHFIENFTVSRAVSYLSLYNMII